MTLPFDMPDLQTLLVAEVIVAAAAILQAAIGMGFGMLAAPLLAVLDPSLVPGAMIQIGVLTALLGAVRERTRISWPEWRIGFVGRIMGAAAAGILLTQIQDRALFSLVFGSLILVAVGLTFSGWKIPFTDRNLFGLSIFSGLMGTITSVGAPPMALIYQSRDVIAARPTLNALFASGSVIAIPALALTGWLSWRDTVIAVLLIPGMLLGFRLARYVMKYVDSRFRLAALGLSFAAAVILIGRGVSSFS